MKKIFCFLFLLLLANLAAVAQQDPQFTFNKLTQLTVNPGFAGNDGAITGLILNRYQWMGYEGAPKTLVFSIGASTNLFGKESGVGLNVISDELGYFANTSVTLDYAYRTETGLGSLGIGVSAGFYNVSMGEGTEWKTPDDVMIGPSGSGGSGDALIPEGDVSQLAFDLGLGVYLKSKNYFLGASVTHINQAEILYLDEPIYYLARNYYISAGYNISLTDPLFELQPSIHLKSDLVSYQADFNVDLVYKKRFWAGMNYRIRDAISILTGVELENGLRVGIAYDIMTLALGRYGSGSAEFFLSYSIDLGKSRNKKYKSVRFL